MGSSLMLIRSVAVKAGEGTAFMDGKATVTHWVGYFERLLKPDPLARIMYLWVDSS